MQSILYGILSAATWGAADFLGGLGSKRTSPYRILFLAEIAGGIPFVLLAVLLAWIFLKERITWLQGLGVLLAFGAIILFTF